MHASKRRRLDNADSVETPGAASSAVGRSYRLERLSARLLSTAVQAPVPEAVEEPPCKLTAAEVAKVFESHVHRRGRTERLLELHELSLN